MEGWVRYPSPSLNQAAPDRLSTGEPPAWEQPINPHQHHAQKDKTVYIYVASARSLHSSIDLWVA